MEPAMYERVFRLQGRHWWYASRKRFLDVLLRHLPKNGRVLDAGCGPGSMLHYLGKYGEVTGVDSYKPALDMAKTHFDGQLLEGDCCLLPFPAAHFSMIAACEVLYHRNIVDVRQVLHECARVLEPGGHLVVVDSAYSACFSAHDLGAHGARRFNRKTLVEAFQAAGMEVVHSTYAYSLLLPVVWLVRRIKKILNVEEEPGAEISETWEALNSLLIGWFTLEAQVAGRWGMPFGLSIQILGRKKLKDEG
jgi:ubiquinone/menaquinone biosynthesis C-methylase UbiE